MKIYHYSPDNCEFIGESLAPSNPAFGETGQPEFLIPARSTTIRPPTTEEREAAIFTGSEWRIVPDFRGVTAYAESGESVIITQLNKTIESLGLLETKPAPTPEQIYQELESAVDNHVDSVAQAKGYDNRVTATMRAGYENPWQAEGIAFGQWMDSCYAYCQGVHADVLAELRPVPTKTELIAELPEMVWS